jgi:hypothetical protein
MLTSSFLRSRLYLDKCERVSDWVSESRILVEMITQFYSNLAHWSSMLRARTLLFLVDLGQRGQGHLESSRSIWDHQGGNVYNALTSTWSVDFWRLYPLSTNFGRWQLIQRIDVNMIGPFLATDFTLLCRSTSQASVACSYEVGYIWINVSESVSESRILVEMITQEPSNQFYSNLAQWSSMLRARTLLFLVDLSQRGQGHLGSSRSIWGHQGHTKCIERRSLYRASIDQFLTLVTYIQRIVKWRRQHDRSTLPYFVGLRAKWMLHV